LREKSFQRNSQNIFEGFFILNGTSSNLIIYDVNFTNFYAILNYNSLIYDIYQNSKILINTTGIMNVFFAKGIFYIDFTNKNPNYFEFRIENAVIIGWNFYAVDLDLGSNFLFNEVQSSTILLAFSSEDSFFIKNVSMININVGYILILKDVSISLDGISIENLKGSFIYDYRSIIIISNLLMNFVQYVSSILTIFEAYDSHITLNNSQFSNIIGCGMQFQNVFLRFSNLIVYNLSYPCIIYTMRKCS